MISEPSQQDRSTAQFAVGLWIWTIVVTVGSGIAFGSALHTGGGWAFGAMVGALSSSVDAGLPESTMPLGCMACSAAAA